MPTLPNKPVKYPKWSYVHNVDTDEYFLILEKTKRKFISSRAFSSWSIIPIIGNNISLSKYILGGKIGYRPGTLIKCVVGGAYYIVDSDNVIHAINTPDFFTVGFNLCSVFIISNEDLEFHQKGDPIENVFL